MSSESNVITSPSKQKVPGVNSSPSGLKSKAKGKDNSPHHGEQEGDDDLEDDDDDDDDEMESGEEDDEEEVMEEDLAEIDPTIIKARRTRGIRVDYTSKEAIAKAGLDGAVEEDDHDHDDVHAMKE